MATKEKDAAHLALESLNPRQRKFAEGFCATFNATKAAVLAGYSEKTARSIGSENLTKPDIKTAVRELLKKSAMDPEEIAARWTRLARAGLQDFYTKVEYEKTSEVEQPLMEAIEKIKEDIDYEYEFMIRSWEVLGTSEEDQGKELLQHEQYKRRRKLDILRYKMQLERDPKAFRIADGPKVKKYRLELDLVKAEELGMLDLIKAVVPTEFGLKIELRSPDSAMDNMAKHLGMLTNKVDLTSKGESITPKHDPAVLAAKLSPEQLAALRAAHETLGTHEH
jgi:phage terminase small subunit